MSANTNPVRRVSRPTTPEDLWRLADKAKANGIRILRDHVTGAYLATSASQPGLLYQLTGFSCTCKGFITHQRCQHHSLLLAELGWLPDVPDPEPADQTVGIAVVQSIETPDPWDECPLAAKAVEAPVVAPSNVVPFVSREDREAGLQATVSGAIECLAERLNQGHSAEYLATLAFYARFHRYSVNNTLLILGQKPDATRVAGLKRWNELGYRVRAGEKAIWIWAPITKKEVDQATGELTEAVVGFRPAPVFDAGQLADLAEKPLPEFVPALPDDVEPLYQSVKSAVEKHGIVVRELALPDSTYGMSQGGIVILRAGMDSRNRLFTLLHEFAHELAHHGEAQQLKPVQQREFEAESAAYVVAAALGLDHQSAADYLLTYEVTAETLKASLATVQQLVRRVMAVVAVDLFEQTLAA